MSYVERCRQHRWRCAEVTFTCPDRSLCQNWVSSLREQLATFSKTSQQHTASYSAVGGLFCNLVVVVVYSQQTQMPVGLHQPTQREASGQTHLPAEGVAAVHPGLHYNSCCRWVLSSLSGIFSFQIKYNELYNYVLIFSPGLAVASIKQLIINLSGLFEYLTERMSNNKCFLTVVIVTEHANHARDHLRTFAELKMFDGWVWLLWYNQIISSGVWPPPLSLTAWCVWGGTVCSARSSMGWSGGRSWTAAWIRTLPMKNCLPVRFASGLFLQVRHAGVIQERS